MARSTDVIRALYDAIDEDAAKDAVGGLLPALTERENRLYAQYLDQVAEEAEEAYADDGSPVVFAFQGTGGVKCCAYRWAPPEALLIRDISPSSNGGTNVGASTSINAPPPYSSDVSRYRRLYWSPDWVPIDWDMVKGAIIYAHGITENARTGMLRIRATEDVLGPDDHNMTQALTAEQQQKLKTSIDADKGHYIKFEKSWVDMFTQAGYVVYAMDNQGHGLSQGWKGDRCNVERLAYMFEDFIQLIRSLVGTGEIPQNHQNVDIFAAGLSLGGLITTRALQIGFDRHLLQTMKGSPEPTVKEDTGEVIPRLSGFVLLAPAISGERLKKKFPNRCLLPIMNIISSIMPSMRAAKLERNSPYAFIASLIQKDPLVFEKSIPIRISAESVLEMDRVLPNVEKLPELLPICLIQSAKDTMTDPEGSAAFMRLVSSTDKHTEWLDYSWHWLAKEPGYGQTANRLLRWLDSHLYGLQMKQHELEAHQSELPTRHS